MNEAIYQEIMDKTEPLVEAVFVKGGHTTQAEADAHVVAMEAVLAPYGMIDLIARHMDEGRFSD